ncbi:hypothetical protein DJ66_0381 [Candidatus Liberibacter solanacearum]|uniref:Uncharacterized protein n=1 Tax=Candidatus Liberibacter solanacearum TaxID=556287 RepID=A0A0F4VJW5_9HYPH|nr:hypothetical protein DJ66_0381 [Candidatus Liberibacter solanacearum]
MFALSVMLKYINTNIFFNSLEADIANNSNQAFYYQELNFLCY